MSDLTHALRNRPLYEGHGEISSLGEQAADRIDALENVFADIMQYDLRGIVPHGLLLRMEELEVVI